mmetsp:Transcript_9704/g.26050  ORF Transcript_9704/g.26050 Transcript_9704/m.26050 type:complete len:143 (-) Transcript_9704:53-481(-)|eukprot:CAMPEP_0113896690 /NCGR_PEP_ID=MMETSP0780_2-20120614/18193_1 /TAXON_ID=652834 /ORGANISM="Palpitomonas bilix" /LENGTH=142 /DNA_ID=CAMNT_0000887929 /DNA_START=272 /DNA_END=700 /DNA_ORIENTATION=- /assembly_acc=CAM_ASM_000599
MTVWVALGNIMFPFVLALVLDGIRQNSLKKGDFFPQDEQDKGLQAVSAALFFSSLLDIGNNFGILPFADYYVSLLSLTYYFLQAAFALACYIGILMAFAFIVVLIVGVGSLYEEDYTLKGALIIGVIAFLVYLSKSLQTFDF